jgi:hypothetical protein
VIFGKIRHYVLNILEIFQQSLRQLSYVEIVEILGGRFGHCRLILGAFSRHVIQTSVLQARLIIRFLTGIPAKWQPTSIFGYGNQPGQARLSSDDPRTLSRQNV